MFESLVNLVEVESKVGWAYFSERLRHLSEGNILRQASLNGDFDIDNPSEVYDAAGKVWAPLLVKAGKRRDKAKSLEHDTRSLSLISWLNERALKNGERVRYLLISTDFAVHAAVDLWRREQELCSVPQFGFMRHPRQYTPILNTNAMRGVAPEDADLRAFERLKQIVEDICVLYKRDESRGLPNKNFPEHVRETLQQELNLETTLPLRSKISAFSSEWQRALKTVLLLNFDTVLHVTDKKISENLQLLTAPDVEGRLVEYFDQSISKLQRQHVMFGARQQISTHVRDLVRNAERGRDYALKKYARSPTLARFHLPQPLLAFGRSQDWPEVTTLPEFITQLVKDGDPKTLEDFASRVERLGLEDVCDLAALMAFRFGDWAQASYLIERRMSGASRADPAFWELQYFAAVADRFQGATLDVLQRNRTLMERQIPHFRRIGDTFGQARACAETAAQCLFFAFDQALPDSSARRVSNAYIASVLRTAHLNLVQGEELIFSASDKVSAPKALLGRLKNHIMTNLLSTSLSHALRLVPEFGGSTPDSSSTLMRRAVKRFDALDKRGG